MTPGWQVVSDFMWSIFFSFIEHNLYVKCLLITVWIGKFMTTQVGVESEMFGRRSLDYIFEWIERGDCVVLHKDCERRSAQVYHFCDKSPVIFECGTVVRYINLVKQPDSLEEDGWSAVLREAGCTRCVCKLAEMVFDSDNIPIYEEYTVCPGAFRG